MRKQWDLYEAALLLDAYLQLEAGHVTRLQTIRFVSQRLRKMAINRGEQIDDLYRNENGISMMLGNMKFVMTDGIEGLSQTSRLFCDIVSLYKTEPEIFQELVERAYELSK